MAHVKFSISNVKNRKFSGFFDPFESDSGSRWKDRCARDSGELALD